MVYNPKIHNRKSIRLRGYNYASEGAYFVTICTQNRECIFGEIENGIMAPNNLGRMVIDEWNRTPLIRTNVELDEFVVMPNHLHGIIIIHGTTVGANSNSPRPMPFRSPSGTIGSIVRGLKSATTKQINMVRATPGMAVWQRNYYEHIIRNKKSWHNIQRYININPMKWAMDKENPDVVH